MKIDELKKTIDDMSYEQMLSRWRFSPVGDALFRGEVGEYFKKIMLEKKKSTDHVATSKRIGWEKG